MPVEDKGNKGNAHSRIQAYKYMTFAIRIAITTASAIKRYCHFSITADVLTI